MPMHGAALPAELFNSVVEQLARGLTGSTPGAGMDFRAFVSAVRPRYVWYRHCEALAQVLQRVADGELRRVLIFAPPRHGKSELVSRLFPAYYLYRRPERWVGLVS